MSNRDQDYDPDVLDWPDNDDPWTDPVDDDSSARPVMELEVVPSRWAPDPQAGGRARAAAPAARRRLWMIATAVAATIAALIWWLGGRTSSSSTTAVISAAPSTTAEQPPTQVEMTDPTVSGYPVPPAVLQPRFAAAAAAAAGFAADYANPGTGKDDWFARVSHWTTPQLTAGYRMTDPNRLPSAAFQRLSPPLNSDSATVLFDAYYDTMTLEIRVVWLDERWQVAAALDTTTTPPDLSPPDSTPAQTPVYIPPDLGVEPADPETRR